MSGKYVSSHRGVISVDLTPPFAWQGRRPLLGQCTKCGLQWRFEDDNEPPLKYLADHLRYHLFHTHGIQPLPKERSHR